LTATLFIARGGCVSRGANGVVRFGLLGLALLAVWSIEAHGSAPSRMRGAGNRVQTATIHWEDVPLRDAIGRLEKLFGTSGFLDRRIDPTTRVDLDMSASSAEQVLARVAGDHGWSVGGLGDVVYLGPAGAVQRLRAAIAARKKEIDKMPPRERAVFARKRPLRWARLTTPRTLVVELVEQNGWQVGDIGRIPHDLWAADQLKGLAFAEQLAVLLAGFDLTYEIRAETRTIQIVPLGTAESLADTMERQKPGPEPPSPQANAATKQVYSLRVAEQPVGGVMRALAKRLNWQVKFDEAAIGTAGKSLDKRVSFAVENVGEDELLQAVLQPAGLTFRREGEVVYVVPEGEEMTNDE
jgi:hypothetical protein